MFLSYLGIEMVAIAAGEAVEPRSAVNRAMRSVIAWILVFFIGSVAVIVLVLPSSDPNVAVAPHTAVLARIALPYAGVVVNLVILTALVSMCNSVFKALLASIGTLGVVVYLFIAATQIRTRSRMSAAEVAALPVRMWGFRWLSVLVSVFIISIPVSLALDPASRRSLLLSGIVTAVALASGVVCGVAARRLARSGPQCLPCGACTRRLTTSSPGHRVRRDP